MMKKIVFIGLAVLVVTVVCYDVYVMHNKNYGLTDLVLPNVEALAEYESDMADPLRLKKCYLYAGTDLLPDEPAEIVVKCNGCATVKSTMHVGDAHCIGSQIIY